jgi:septum formation protein
MRLILASSSPRRRAILQLLGAPFEVIAPDVKEEMDPRRPAPDEASHWAMQKARAVAAEHPDAVVLGSDTLIDLDRVKLGKPRDPEEAFGMLRRLAGRSHWVVTAVGAVLPGGRERRAIEVAKVTFNPASDEDLRRYVATGDPLDKAGGYSAQGPGEALIASIDGDFLAVVGLPLKPVARILREAKVTLPNPIDQVYQDRAFLNWRRFAS